MRVQWIEEPSRSFSSLLLIFLAHVVVFAIALALPRLALAQVPLSDFSVSVFGGAALPFKTDIKETNPTIAEDLTFKDVKLEDSASFGGKLSFWNTGTRPNAGFDLGVELDITSFSPDIRDQTVSAAGLLLGAPFSGPITFTAIDINATIVAVNLLVRWPVGVTQQFPFGQWHPYVGIGGGFEIARAKDRVLGVSDTDTAGAFQILTGLKVFLSRNIALFGEYKFTRADHTFNLDTFRDKLTVAANHVVGGVAIHY